jgi:hypothetical protein
MCRLADLGEDGVLTVMANLKLGGRDIAAGIAEPPVIPPVDILGQVSLVTL